MSMKGRMHGTHRQPPTIGWASNWQQPGVGNLITCGMFLHHAEHGRNEYASFDIMELVEYLTHQRPETTHQIITAALTGQAAAAIEAATEAITTSS